MEPSIFRYIIRFSLRQQITLCVMAALSFPFLWLYYEMPKQIIKVINPEPGQAVRHTFWGITVPDSLFGIQIGQLEILFLLCALLLLLVIINQRFKYWINVYKGITAERMLRRLRYDLYSRVLRFPLPTFRRMSSGEIIPMITNEVEPLGGFIGDAFSLPAFQGGTLLVILAFLFSQDVIMATAAVALYPLQAYLIPKMQRKVNRLGKERVKLMRKLADRVGESVQGVQEIRANHTSNLELADFSDRLGGVFWVRFEIYNRKFAIKSINNFIQQLGPIFFYSIGGYLVINGELSIGALVAAIAAQKDLAAPWKELLDFYQTKEDARIKYEQVIGQFDPPGLLPVELQVDSPAEVPRLKGELVAGNVVLRDDNDSVRLEGVSFKVPLAGRTAICGPHGGGKEDLVYLIARLLSPTSGRITVDGQAIHEMHEALTGRRMAFVGPNAFLFSASLGDNLFYSLKHRQLAAPTDGDEAARREREKRRRELAASGNFVADVDAPWIDLEEAGAADAEDLVRIGLATLRKVGLGEDVYRFGLSGTIDADKAPELSAAVLRARARLRQRLLDPELAPLIEPFDRLVYNRNASVAENILFGTPVGKTFELDALATQPYMRQVLEKTNLRQPLIEMGRKVAETMLEIFSGLPPEHEMFQQFNFVSADDLPDLPNLLARAERAKLTAEDEAQLLGFPFKLIPARHRLGLIDERMMVRLLDARRTFADELPDEYRDSIAFFEEDAYNPAANLMDNILFGKVAYGVGDAPERIGQLVREVVHELGLEDAVAGLGLNYQVGVGGSRLTGAQRQRLALARAVMKRPDVLILLEPTAALDAASQQQLLDMLLEECGSEEAEGEGARGLIWALHRPEDARHFDRVLVVAGGHIVDNGPFEQVSAADRPLGRMLPAGG